MNSNSDEVSSDFDTSVSSSRHSKVKEITDMERSFSSSGQEKHFPPRVVKHFPSSDSCDSSSTKTKTKDCSHSSDITSDSCKSKSSKTSSCPKSSSSRSSSCSDDGGDCGKRGNFLFWIIIVIVIIIVILVIYAAFQYNNNKEKKNGLFSLSY